MNRPPVTIIAGAARGIGLGVAQALAQKEYARAMATVWVAQLMTAGSVSLLILLPRLLDRQRIDLSWRGWIMAAFSFAYVIGTLSSGHCIRKLGYRATAVLGCVSAVGGCLLYATGWHWMPAYFAARGLHGLGCGWLMLAFQGWMMDIAHVQQRGRTLGLTNLPAFIMVALSPVIAETVSRLGLASGVFFLAAAMCLSLLPLLGRLPARPLNREEHPLPVPDRLDGREWCMVFLLLTHGMVLGYATVLLPLASDPSKDWSFSMFFLAYGTTTFLTRAVLEPRLRAWLPIGLLTATVGLVSMGTAALAAASRTETFVVIGILFGLGHGLFFPSAIQLVTECAARNHVVHRVGMATAAMLVGNMIGESSAGVAAKALGVPAALAWGGCLIVFGQMTLLITINLGRKTLRQREAATVPSPLATYRSG